MEIDFEPDFSGINFDDPLRANLVSSRRELTVEQFLEFLPWVNLEGLPLPQGHEIISFTHAEGGVLVLEEVYLRNKYPDAPITKLYVWISDGLRGAEICIAFVGDQKQVSTYSVEVLETSPETLAMIVVPEADTVFSVYSDGLNSEEKIALLKSFVPEEQ